MASFFSVVRACILSAIFLLFSCHVRDARVNGTREGGDPEGTDGFASLSKALQHSRAVSLRILQQKAAQDVRDGNHTEAIFQLCGINKLLGYLLDMENNDLILIGSSDKTTPAVELDNLVVALRNVWKKYLVVKDSQYYYSPPGCSIDPNAGVVGSLQQIGRTILASQKSDDIQMNIERWKSVCGQPQSVRVLGIPQATKFAKIMIEADYDMKRIVDGSDRLNLEGFQSLPDMTLNLIQAQWKRYGRILIPLSTLNRFWFYPGRTGFTGDGQLVLLEQSEVTLLTEREYLTQRGEIAGSGESDSLANAFANNFSLRYREIAEQKPIYAELDGLFRLTALMNIIQSRDDVAKAGLDINYFLDEYPIKPFLVSNALPGRSNVKQAARRMETVTGYTEEYFWLPTCGGVSIDFKPKESGWKKLKSNISERIQKNILNAGPSSQSLFWDFSSN
jgi:hypothetical protein